MDGAAQYQIRMSRDESGQWSLSVTLDKLRPDGLPPDTMHPKTAPYVVMAAPVARATPVGVRHTHSPTVPAALAASSVKACVLTS